MSRRPGGAVGVKRGAIRKAEHEPQKRQGAKVGQEEVNLLETQRLWFRTWRLGVLAGKISKIFVSFVTFVVNEISKGNLHAFS